MPTAQCVILTAFYLREAALAVWHEEFMFERRDNMWWTNSVIIAVSPYCQQRSRKRMLPGCHLYGTAPMHTKIDPTRCDVRKLISLVPNIAMDVLATLWRDRSLLVTGVRWRISFLTWMSEVQPCIFSFLQNKHGNLSVNYFRKEKHTLVLCAQWTCWH